MVHEKLSNMIYLYSESLKDLEWLKHGFSLKSTLTEGKDKTERASQFAQKLTGSIYPVYMGEQVHNDKIGLINESIQENDNSITILPQTDAIILHNQTYMQLSAL